MNIGEQIQALRDKGPVLVLSHDAEATDIKSILSEHFNGKGDIIIHHEVNENDDLGRLILNFEPRGGRHLTVLLAGKSWTNDVSDGTIIRNAMSLVTTARANIDIRIYQEDKILTIETYGEDLILASNKTFVAPENPYRFVNLEHIDGVFCIASHLPKLFKVFRGFIEGNSLKLYYYNHITFVNDGKSAVSTNVVNQLASVCRNLGIRTQLVNGPLTYLETPPKADIALRENKGSSFRQVEGSGGLYDTATVKWLIENGYIQAMDWVMPEDDDADIAYRICHWTAKAKDYRNIYITRKSAAEGACREDVLFNTEDGKFYKVMDFDIATSEWFLMCEDMTARTVTLEQHTTYYIATEDEAKQFLENLK